MKTLVILAQCDCMIVLLGRDLKFKLLGDSDREHVSAYKMETCAY